MAPVVLAVFGLAHTQVRPCYKPTCIQRSIAKLKEQWHDEVGVAIHGRYKAILLLIWYIRP